MIIQFVVKTVVGMIDWGMDPQQAVSWWTSGQPTRRRPTWAASIPTSTPPTTATTTRWWQGLRKLGHQVDLADQSSGLSAIVRGAPGWIGGADPRREGLVMGDPR